MLVKGAVRLAIVVGSVVVSTCFLIFYSRASFPLALPTSKWRHTPSNTSSPGKGFGLSETHIEVSSPSTKRGKYFLIEFGQEHAMNPSIIPHPTQAETWIIVAQLRKDDTNKSPWYAELVCDAKFRAGKLACVKPPMILPIAATAGGKCVDDLAYFSLNVGPHDARVFYGPRGPFTIYGSNSVYTCFGQWIQDFTMLVDWGTQVSPSKRFRMAAELERPAPFRAVEKNFFVFWDKDGGMYVHYDVSPRRVFAKLDDDGSVGPDLSPLALPNDEKCMAAYMPTIAPELESIHQATNSLSITLCNRSDLSCESNEWNTYILTIFQHKSFYSYHSTYEPYVMLFKREPPFEVYGISSKPIWIRGRATARKLKGQTESQSEDLDSWQQMLYITSVSWKTHGQKYHGYLDDVLFIGFGIEDERTAAIDIVAGDLIREINLCSML